MTDTAPIHGLTDVRITAADAASRVQSGMTVAIGGWGARRKPMAVLRELMASDVDDLTVISYGGPDVGMLCRAGKVRRLIYAFVSLDDIPLEPHFRAARQSGAIEVTELDEGQILLGLQAAAWRVPFLPTRVGLGTDVADGLATVRSPYPSPDGAADEELIAVPALRPDVALLHLNVADPAGSCAFTGPDIYFDDLMAQAANETYVSVERVVPTEQLAEAAGCRHALAVPRLWVDGVIEAPGGAAPTSCQPDYEADWDWLGRYAKARTDEEWGALWH